MNRVIPVLALCLGAGVAFAKPQPNPYPGDRPLVCAGVADIGCPSDMICAIPDESIDRTGVCLSPEQICQDSMCPQTICPEGTHHMPVPSRCCGICAPNIPRPADGSCQVKEECIGKGMPHSQCIGEWRCEWQRCVYRCMATSPLGPAN